jgi:signal peptidase
MKKNNLKENIEIVVTTLLIGFFLIYIIVQLFLPNMSVKVFGFKPYIVITESMEPVISVNDMVVDRKFKLDKAKEGDIVTFLADIDYNGTKEVVTHYIYSINEVNDTAIIRTHRYYAPGETVVPDTWLLSPDDILGTYWFTLPKVGYLTNYLKSPYGIVTIIINIGIISGIVYLVKHPQVEDNTDNQEKQ